MAQWLLSYTKGLQFESGHQQNYIINIFTVNCCIDKKMEKHKWRKWLILKINYSFKQKSHVTYVKANFFSLK